MSAPPSPPTDELRERPFSFYPPILRIEHNEWRLKEATWSEMLVKNTKTGLEVGVPRRYFGQLSSVEEPVMIVGLTRELEYRAGSVWPTERRVLSMPEPVLRKTARVPGQPAPAAPGRLRSMIGMGSPAAESRVSRLILTALGSVTLVGLAVWAVVALAPETKPTFVGKDQTYLELTRDDDYFAVVRKLGPPTWDRWKTETGELQFRALGYKQRGYAIILMGTDREAARYIGTMTYAEKGQPWRPLHYIEYARGGASTASMLRTLPPF
jgi:hypothetical protein